MLFFSACQSRKPHYWIPQMGQFYTGSHWIIIIDYCFLTICLHFWFHPSCCSHLYAYRIDNTAQSLKDENWSPVVIEAVTFCSLYTYCHKRFGFRFCACQETQVLQKTQESVLWGPSHKKNPPTTRYGSLLGRSSPRGCNHLLFILLDPVFKEPRWLYLLSYLPASPAACPGFHRSALFSVPLTSSNTGTHSGQYPPGGFWNVVWWTPPPQRKREGLQSNEMFKKREREFGLLALNFMWPANWAK